MTEEYNDLNEELRMLLFSIEQTFGVKPGNGRVFLDPSKRRELSDIRHVFAFIAITYLEYTHKQVREFIGMKYDSNVNYARKRIVKMIEFNRVYRNRVYMIAVSNGIMELVFDIIQLVDKNDNRIKF